MICFYGKTGIKLMYWCVKLLAKMLSEWNLHKWSTFIPRYIVKESNVSVFRNCITTLVLPTVSVKAKPETFSLKCGWRTQICSNVAGKNKKDTNLPKSEALPTLTRSPPLLGGLGLCLQFVIRIRGSVIHHGVTIKATIITCVHSNMPMYCITNSVKKITRPKPPPWVIIKLPQKLPL